VSGNICGHNDRGSSCWYGVGRGQGHCSHKVAQDSHPEHSPQLRDPGLAWPLLCVFPAVTCLGQYTVSVPLAATVSKEVVKEATGMCSLGLTPGCAMWWLFDITSFMLLGLCKKPQGKWSMGMLQPLLPALVASALRFSGDSYRGPWVTSPRSDAGISHLAPGQPSQPLSTQGQCTKPSRGEAV
jgi:hypothetical protein